MRMSAAGILLLEHFEGCVLYPYDDADHVWPRRRLVKTNAGVVYADGSGKVKGYPTIGIGHVILAGENLWHDITRNEAVALLRKDIAPREGAVARHVEPELNAHQFDACVSLAYNIGVGAFAKSSLLRAINERRWSDCPALFALWNKSLGKVNNGLVIRRAKEAALFMEPMPLETIDVGMVMSSVWQTADRMIAELNAAGKPPTDPSKENA